MCETSFNPLLVVTDDLPRVSLRLILKFVVKMMGCNVNHRLVTKTQRNHLMPNELGQHELDAIAFLLER